MLLTFISNWPEVFSFTTMMEKILPTMRLFSIAFILITLLVYPTSIHAQQRSFTLPQVAEHNSNGNCWVIYDQKVYDVSEYLASETDSIISNNCGKSIDDTVSRAIEAGDTQAAVFLKDYFIGLQSNSSSPVSLTADTAGFNIELGWLVSCLFVGGVVFVVGGGYLATRKFADEE